MSDLWLRHCTEQTHFRSSSTLILTDIGNAESTRFLAALTMSATRSGCRSSQHPNCSLKAQSCGHPMEYERFAIRISRKMHVPQLRSTPSTYGRMSSTASAKARDSCAANWAIRAPRTQVVLLRRSEESSSKTSSLDGQWLTRSKVPRSSLEVEKSVSRAFCERENSAARIIGVCVIWQLYWATKRRKGTGRQIKHVVNFASRIAVPLKAYVCYT